MLNLFIAVIVNAVQLEQHNELEASQQVVTTRLDKDTQILHSEINSLRSEIQEIKTLLQR